MKLHVLASRLAAIAILLGVILAGQLTFGRPLIDSFFAHRESIAQSQAILAKYQALNTSRGQINVKLQGLRAAQENEGRLLTGESAQLVGAQVQNRLKELAEVHNANVGSMQLLAVRQDQGFQRVSMAVALKARIEALQSILYEIENQSPYFFIEKLELRRDRGFVNTAQPEKENELQVRLEFYGYMPPEVR